LNGFHIYSSAKVKVVRIIRLVAKTVAGKDRL
jgi:hypothetical protein